MPHCLTAARAIWATEVAVASASYRIKGENFSPVALMHDSSLNHVDESLRLQIRLLIMLGRRHSYPYRFTALRPSWS